MEKVYKIEKFGAFGEGVARDGKTVFIKGALPGETVLATPVLDKKNFTVARLNKVISASPDRVTPPCKYADRCGGCGLQHLSYAAQLRLKEQTVVETLHKVGGLNVTADKVVGSPSLRYRNKLSFPVRGRCIGLFAENTHNVVDIDDCLLQREWNAPLIAALRSFMRDRGLRGYDEKGGDIRHIVAREKSGGMCIVIVTFKRIDVSGFLGYIPFENFALYQNVNPRNDNVILGDEFYLLGGKGIRPDFHPASFYQVNDFIEDRLYGDAQKECGFGTVIDAFCGAGNLTLRLAQSAKTVYGVEICREAVTEAVERANKAHALNVQFICGDCKTEFPRLAEKIKAEAEENFRSENFRDGDFPRGEIDRFDGGVFGSEIDRTDGVFCSTEQYDERAKEGIIDHVPRPNAQNGGDDSRPNAQKSGDNSRPNAQKTGDNSRPNAQKSGDVTVLFDPPRKGVDESSLLAALALAPSKIIYISCNPPTLARDLKILSRDYDLVRLNLYDMFPMTPHVETMAVLQRK